VKKVKEYLNDYHKDLSPDIDISKLKHKIHFNDKESIHHKNRFWDFKLVFSIIVTMALVIPLTYFATIITMPTNSGDPSRDINQYLDINFENYSDTAIETAVLTENVMVSFYLAENGEEFYLVAQIHSLENHLLEFYVDSKEVMDIDMNAIIINNFKIINHQFDIELLLFNNQEIIETRTISFNIETYINFLN